MGIQFQGSDPEVVTALPRKGEVYLAEDISELKRKVGINAHDYTVPLAHLSSISAKSQGPSSTSCDLSTRFRVSMSVPLACG